MATLQRFKVLATQCGVEQSPTRSPRTSPLVQLRRRKTTLRMLLSLRSPSRREPPPPIHQPSTAAGFSGNCSRVIAGRTLKDLFVSSPSMGEEDDDESEAESERRKGLTREEVLSAMASKLNGACIGANLGSRQDSARAAWFGFSKRLLRKAWRPVLVTIPE
ncbi:PREDICTED: uncharacterized protein LOC104808293 [Tarenaya hassleriana]|uniref:uncharacterized protein LOC104808293 n=1 Tax=Tarenaya hassleriana TaxID=28532 RepID=UPI00053C4CC1|nr:PREDICTED: uncharacterized protein LOC104808293 [Tarenaya hassleriana]